ncbi:MAG: Ig-like domain-containing protein, partial [Tepidisphaeraceae bacterium]
MTFTATITANAPGSGIPTGTVTLMDGSTTLGTGTLNGSGIATFNISNLSIGSHSVAAVYGGDTDFVTSTSSAVNQTVNQDATTSVVASSANPSLFGQSVTFTATITADAPGSGIPTGSVTFKDGSTTLGTGTLNGSGVATFSTSNLSVGSHSITAVYGGDTDFVSSTSSAVNQTVNQDATTSSVASSANPSVFGQSVTFTATVTASAPGSGIPTGSVTFMDGSTTLGTGTLNGSGVATFNTSNLSIASHSVTAVYGGDSDFTTSTSSAVNQTVNQDATTSVVASSANPSLFGQSVTFTATITANAPGSGIPTGSVTFMDGSTTLGTGTLDGSGVATFNTSNLSVGSHSITAVYGADTDFTASTSSTLSQVVDPDATTSGVASSADPSDLTQSITFTATVTADSPGSGIPTGSVTFYDGSTILGSGLLNGSGIATFSTSNLDLGSHSISAVYNGSSQYVGSTSSVLIQTVNAPVPTMLSISGLPATLTAGATGGVLVVEITSNNGTIDPAFNSAVAISIVSGPAGAKLGGTLTAMASNGVATFSDLRITQQGTYVLEISTNGLTTDTAPITINAGPPSQLGVTVKPSPSWQFGSISPAIVVGVTDQYGNLVTAGNPSVTA